MQGSPFAHYANETRAGHSACISTFQCSHCYYAGLLSKLQEAANPTYPHGGGVGEGGVVGEGVGVGFFLPGMLLMVPGVAVVIGPFPGPGVTHCVAVVAGVAVIEAVE